MEALMSLLLFDSETRRLGADVRRLSVFEHHRFRSIARKKLPASLMLGAGLEVLELFHRIRYLI